VTSREDRTVIDILINVLLKENVVEVYVAVVESERIGFEMKKPRRKAMRVLMHHIPEGMG